MRSSPASAARTCRSMTASVCPARRSSARSPTAAIGRRPCATALATLRPTPSSVSPSYWRRSECPRMTKFARPASMSGLVSPVKAPRSSKCMVWAPSATAPVATRATSASQMVGGQITVVTSGAATAATSTVAASESASSRLGGFIFQLPAITGRRINPPCPRRARRAGEADG